MISFEKRTALITGASSGIGKAFAEALSARGANVILVARSKDKLTSLASEIKKQFKVKAEVIAADLSDPKAPPKIHAAVIKKGYQVDVLINNAGFGTYGQFHTQSADKENKEVMVNAAAVVQLTHLFLPSMVKKREGIIVNVASTGAFQPVPFSAVYGATKAFVLSFSEALWVEYRKQGIRVLALCPGTTDTNFFKARGDGESTFGKKRTTESVVKTALKALERGKSYAVDGRLNYLLANLIRLSPRGLAARTTGLVMGPKKRK
jgi:short-subunit dehydrogenase